MHSCHFPPLSLMGLNSQDFGDIIMELLSKRAKMRREREITKARIENEYGGKSGDTERAPYFAFTIRI